MGNKKYFEFSSTFSVSEIVAFVHILFVQYIRQKQVNNSWNDKQIVFHFIPVNLWLKTDRVNYQRNVSYLIVDRLVKTYHV